MPWHNTSKVLECRGLRTGEMTAERLIADLREHGDFEIHNRLKLHYMWLDQKEGTRAIGKGGEEADQTKHEYQRRLRQAIQACIGCAKDEIKKQEAKLEKLTPEEGLTTEKAERYVLDKAISEMRDAKAKQERLLAEVEIALLFKTEDLDIADCETLEGLLTRHKKSLHFDDPRDDSLLGSSGGKVCAANMTNSSSNSMALIISDCG